MMSARFLVVALAGGLPAVAAATPAARNHGPPILLAQLNPTAPPSSQLEPAPPFITRPKRIVDCFAITNLSIGQRIEPTAQFFCSYSPLQGLNVTGSLNFYPVPGQQMEWNPDYTFRASYQLKPRLTLEYGDYNDNRWKGLNASSLFDGTVWMTYQLPTRKPAAGKHHGLGPLSCTASMGVPLKTQPGDPRVRATLGCGISPIKGLSIRVNLNAYPDGRQQPWDPDFTYAVNYQIRPRLSATFSNYSGNRWFWRQPIAGARGGPTFVISYRLF